YVGARLVQRLAGIQALRVRQLLTVPLQQIGNLAEQRGAVGHRGPAPRPVEGLPRGRDRGVHVGGAGLRQGIEHARVVRVDGLRRAVVRGLGPLSGDVQVSHALLPWLTVTIDAPRAGVKGPRWAGRSAPRTRGIAYPAATAGSPGAAE